MDKGVVQSQWLKVKSNASEKRLRTRWRTVADAENLGQRGVFDKCLAGAADIVNERRGATTDTALRFARYFRDAPAFWMNLQTRYDLEVAEDRIVEKITWDVRPLAQSALVKNDDGSPLFLGFF